MSNKKINPFIITAICAFSIIIFHANATFGQHPCDDYPVVTCNIPSSFQNWSVQDNNTLGTGQVGEPRPNYINDTTALNSLWYAWIAPTTGVYVVNTQFTNPSPMLIMDTEIAVYVATGNGSISSLAKVSHNDDWLPNSSPAEFFTCHPSIPRPATEFANSSCLRFTARAGVKYFFQVDGYNSGPPTNPTCTGCGYGPFNLNLYFLAPSAAEVSVSGRVTDSKGQGISRTVVSLTDTNGNIHTALTSTFGYYRFDDVAAGQSYLLQAASKKAQFANNPRFLNVVDNVVDENFNVLEN
jgi:hypothetical protein